MAYLVLFYAAILSVVAWAWIRNNAVYDYCMRIIDADYEDAKRSIDNGELWNRRWKNSDALPEYNEMWLSPRKWPLKRLRNKEEKKS